MKLIRLTFLFLLLFSWQARAEYGLKILNWQDDINLNDKGKSSQTNIKALSNLPANQEITSYSISFATEQKIKINQIRVDNKLAEFTFINNILTVNFPRGKSNGEIANIFISYDEIYDQVAKFLRQEEIYVPAFAAGATAQVKINFPGYLESATLNSNIKKIGNAFVYNNVVPKNGVRELIKLTPTEGIWDVNLKIKISSDKNLGKISVTVPQYFQDPLQKVENYLIAPNLNPTKQKLTKNGIVLDFDTIKDNLQISSKAIIYTGDKYRSQIMRNPQNYLKYSQEESAMLTATLQKIKQNPEYKDLPLYAKIGQYVHDYIKYDASFTGKLPSLDWIVKNKVGVCTEYAKLYSALTRVAGIPTATLYGGACGDNDRCEGHSWNLIYVDNQWLQVDPTWNLMSGIVSSSHVYLVENKLEGVQVEYEYKQNETPQKIQSDFEFKMTSVTR